MDWSWFAGLIGFAFAMAVTPGPNNTIVTANAAIHGLAGTISLMIGIAVGVAAITFTVVALGSPLVSAPGVNAVLQWLGLAYILWLAWRIGTAQPALDAGNTHSNLGPPLSFAQGALFQLINPKLWVMVGGAVVTYGPMAELNRIQLSSVFAALFGGMTFASLAAWAALGVSIRRFLASPRARRIFNAVMAFLLLTSLIPIVTTFQASTP